MRCDVESRKSSVHWLQPWQHFGLIWCRLIRNPGHGKRHNKPSRWSGESQRQDLAYSSRFPLLQMPSYWKFALQIYSNPLVVFHSFDILTRDLPITSTPISSPCVFSNIHCCLLVSPSPSLARSQIRTHSQQLFNLEAAPKVRNPVLNFEYFSDFSLAACVDACCYVYGCDGYLGCGESYVSESQNLVVSDSKLTMNVPSATPVTAFVTVRTIRRSSNPWTPAWMMSCGVELGSNWMVVKASVIFTRGYVLFLRWLVRIC